MVESEATRPVENPPPALPASRLSTWATLAALVGLVVLIVVASDLAGLVVVGIVLAYLLLPLVDALERRGVRRSVGAAIVLIGVLVVLGGGLALTLPLVVEQGVELREQWENGELLHLLEDAETTLTREFSFLEPGQVGLVEAVRSTLSAHTGPLAGYVPDALATLGNAVVIPFVLFALLKDGPTLRRRLLSVVPNRYFEFAMTVVYKVDASLGDYLRGQAFVALLVGTSTAIGLGIVGVNYYLVLGLVTGLANFVPYIGFFVSAGLTIMVSIVTTGGMDQVLSIVFVFIVLQSIENIVFQPWITGKNVSMHPVLVLLAILVGGRVAGVLGMALGVPTAAILKVLFLETAIGLRRYHL